MDRSYSSRNRTKSGRESMVKSGREIVVKSKEDTTKEVGVMGSGKISGSLREKPLIDPEGSKFEMEPDFYRQFTNITNEYRARHQSPPIFLANDLNAYAQQWANRLAQTNIPQHRFQVEKCDYGENIFFKSHTLVIKFNPREAIEKWYSESNDYYYYGGDPPRSEIAKIGHFTNLVWYSTKRMGLGISKSKMQAYLVCYYDPAGNLFGAFKDNVLPPIC